MEGGATEAQLAVMGTGVAELHFQCEHGRC